MIRSKYFETHQSLDRGKSQSINTAVALEHEELGNTWVPVCHFRQDAFRPCSKSFLVFQEKSFKEKASKRTYFVFVCRGAGLLSEIIAVNNAAGSGPVFMDLVSIIDAVNDQ